MKEEIATNQYPELSIRKEDGLLVAQLVPSGALQKLSKVRLDEQIRQAEVRDWCVFEEATKALLERAEFNEAFEITLAERRDAQLRLEVASDKMKVTGHFEPARGGKPLSEDQVLIQLAELGVLSARISAGTVKHLVESKTSTGAILARGLRPVPGTDARFIPLFDIDNRHTPALRVDDSVDYFSTKDYLSVEAGTPLMHRAPATDGIQGIDVFGKELPAKKGKNLKFKKHKGSAVSRDSENVLIAAVGGHPVLEQQGVKVDDTLILPRADLTSGNVDFDGSVMISGDVMPQVKIKATGDIFIKGTVENATIECSGSIVIGGGVISESVPNNQQPPKLNTVLLAKGSIHAAFMNLTAATAGEDIVVQKYLMHSMVHAGANVTVGEKGGKGAIIAGETVSTLSLIANILGSPAYLPTRVKAGDESLVALEQAEAQRLIQKRTRELKQLTSILEKYEKAPEKAEGTVGTVPINKLNKIRSIVKALQANIDALNIGVSHWNSIREGARHATITVNKAMYPKVHVTLGEARLEVENEQKKCVMFLQDNQIKFK